MAHDLRLGTMRQSVEEGCVLSLKRAFYHSKAVVDDPTQGNYSRRGDCRIQCAAIVYYQTPSFTYKAPRRL